ncbi:hypothetical protein D5F11_007170 [Siminovitchia terrae]|uniref:Uncharacterized protein n=1 Tax=Siminovitchia terrae TaxID=1914933 RepID=A0A429XA42_SIMTE|nr:hypothetical protein [Siminovitchia terrae]RST60229.1 hypothetical protein D5F11_007170 [Siminovitchia terrae]
MAKIEGRGGGVLRLRDDFYFWASWILLGCLCFLIFYLYQEEYKFERILDTKTILGVIGTLGGAFLGAYFAGKYTVKSVREQINYDAAKEKEKEKVSQQKYDVFLNMHLKLMRKEVSRISFFRNLHLSHNPYNVDPLKEIEAVLYKLKEITRTLLSIDLKYISVENYKLLAEINEKIYDIEINFQGHLATEEDEAKNHISMAVHQADHLIYIINESLKSSTGTLEGTEKK